MADVTHVVALSGGKDSTAMALRLAEVEPREYVYLCTPTGRELPEMLAHWQHLEGLLGRPLTRLTNGTLDGWIEYHQALPNWRQRWCTRQLKIEPCIAYLTVHQPATLYVGLRADEPEEDRSGLYGDYATYRYPLREWEWGYDDVWTYLSARGVTIPQRTDCDWCYDQQLVEWKRLWQQHPERYAEAEALEARLGVTFRGPNRDSWPAPLRELRAEFERGRRVRGEDFQLRLFSEWEGRRCRVCSL